jgi:hypothetical protein
MGNGDWWRSPMGARYLGSENKSLAGIPEGSVSFVQPLSNPNAPARSIPNGQERRLVCGTADVLAWSRIRQVRRLIAVMRTDRFGRASADWISFVTVSTIGWDSPAGAVRPPDPMI